MISLYIFLITATPNGVRTVEASGCDVIDVKLSVGMSTLLQFEEDPTLTFHADDQHFLLKSDPSARRSLAVIPMIKEQDLRQLFPSEAGTRYVSPKTLASTLDQIYRTNLFVFFKSSRRLLFRLRFVEKSEADYVLRVKQIYRKGCSL